VAQRPERAPLQGAKVTRCISIESEPLMRRASESLSVTHLPDQQRRPFREAVCEERAGAAAGAGATRQARGVFVLTVNRKETARWCGASRSISDDEWTWPSVCGMSRTAAGDRRPLRTVSRPAYVVKQSKSLFLKPPSEKLTFIFAFRWPFRAPDGVK